MLSMGESFVIYSVMDFIVDNYFPVLHELESEVDAIEDTVFSKGSTRLDVERVFELRHELLLMRRAVLPLQEVCNSLIRFDVTLIAPEMRAYFRDVRDHVIRVVESIDNMRELLKGALEANLLLASVQQNDVTKQLAAWAAILAVPTAIAGVYGMNFKHMPELEHPLDIRSCSPLSPLYAAICTTVSSGPAGSDPARFEPVAAVFHQSRHPPLRSARPCRARTPRGLPRSGRDHRGSSP